MMKKTPTKGEISNLSILLGGKAGSGIERASTILGRLLNRLGYRTYIYRDYPSIIRGGHTFSIIRAAKDRIAAHREQVDIILALDRETLGLHKHRLKKEGIYLHDARERTGPPELRSFGIPLGQFLKEEKAPIIMGNTCMLGAFTKIAGIEFALLEKLLRQELRKDTELNVRVAKRGYDAAKRAIMIPPLRQKSLP